MTTRPPGFYIAPFAIDGEQQGLAYWDMAALSGEWLARCEAHFRQHGLCFDAPWSGKLAHIETKFTAASGVALATFRADGRLAASVLLASGRAGEAESEMMTLFVQSVRRVGLVAAAADSPEPFRRALAIKERPLMIVVPWADDAISDENYELVQELAIHTAGGFFAQHEELTALAH